mmetsp:Transcript_63756/g.103279  ORF Transcript_63756/g.103279 Transcript_63756/m.103279 type:complete len:226 (-) Transcript_63756:15-692(-)
MPTTSFLRLPGSVRSPPGCTMVYVRPEFTRYFSALRFQCRMPPPVLPPGKRPKLFSMCAGSVPPMELQMATCPTPACFAASICAFCPSQSTSYGWPSGNPMFGRPLASFMPPVGLTLAEVPITSAAQPAIAAARPASEAPPAAATSATTTLSGGAPVSAKSASRDAFVRTMPTGWNSVLTSIFLKTCPPVCPPAPVTATRRTAADPVAQESASSAEWRSIRLMAL